MRPHLPEEELHAWLDGELSAAQRSEIARHLLGCPSCRSAEAETIALRERVTAILGLAAPRLAPRRSLPAALRWKQWSGRRMIRFIIPLSASLALMIGAGTLYLITHQEKLPAYAREAFILPSFLPRSQSTPLGEPDGFSPYLRALAMASTGASSISLPKGQFQPTPWSPVQPQSADPLEEDPAPGWSRITSLQLTEFLANAAISMPGLEATSVKELPNVRGGRSAVLIRYQMPDGRSLWAAEGEEGDMLMVEELLTRNGLTISTTRRTTPDYLTAEDGATYRSSRLGLVAASLSPDSVNHLVQLLEIRH